MIEFLRDPEIRSGLSFYANVVHTIKKLSKTSSTSDALRNSDLNRDFSPSLVISAKSKSFPSHTEEMPYRNAVREYRR